MNENGDQIFSTYENLPAQWDLIAYCMLQFGVAIRKWFDQNWHGLWEEKRSEDCQLQDKPRTALSCETLWEHCYEPLDHSWY